MKQGDIVKLQSGKYVPIQKYDVIPLDEPVAVYNFEVAIFSNFQGKFKRKRTAEQAKPAKEFTEYTMRTAIHIMCHFSLDSMGKRKGYFLARWKLL
ncbi:MAG: hypothetical protein ACRCUS_07370 [Anaerovoracaceae bacterium]